MSDVTTEAPRTARRDAFVTGFWSVAFAFLIVMAFATLPSPLYGLYRVRDGLSALTITVVYAVWAASTIATLLAVNRVAARIGRRGTMQLSVVTMMAAAAVLAAWKDLPGLIIGRLLTGTGVGFAAGTAIVYLIELRVASDPSASVVRARVIGTSVNVGALGIGPLIAGCFAQWAKWPLTLSYLVFVALGAVALVGLRRVPETGAPRAGSAPGGPRAPRRVARLPLPAAAATCAAFAANGLFAGLSGLVLSATLHHPAHALAGTTLFIVFSSGVVSQVTTGTLQSRRVLALGTASMLVGLVVLVVSVRLSTPNLAMFLVSGALIGAGAGAVFKGTTGIVLEAGAPQDRVAMTSALLVVLFVGLSVPVIGAGIALNQGASVADTVLAFAIFVGVGTAGAGALLAWPRVRTQPTA